MSNLRIATAERDRGLVVAAGGWIDISNVAELEARLADAIRRPGLRAVGLELAKADYIDSSTISALIRTKALADDAGVAFALIALSPHVRQVLTETHLLEIFTVHPDREGFFATAGDGGPQGEAP